MARSPRPATRAGASRTAADPAGRACGPLAPVGQPVPPTRLRSAHRKALHEAARVPPFDYRDNLRRATQGVNIARRLTVCPIPTGSGKTSGRFRLNRGGNRQANAALYRIVLVRMRWHPPTIAYVERRQAEGRSKKEIIRCLKRYAVREIYQLLPEPSSRPGPAKLPSNKT